MATYEELFTEYGANSLYGKLVTSILVAADTILNELVSVNGHADRVAWAKEALKDPDSQVQALWGAMLAANKGLSIVTIQSATDASIQTNVDAAINIVAGVTT